VDSITSRFVNFLFCIFASFVIVEGLQWIAVEGWDWVAPPLWRRILLVVLTLVFWAPWRKRNVIVKQEERNIQE
jgi:hypothetical protein